MAAKKQNLNEITVPTSGPGAIEKQMEDGSVLKKLIGLFRTTGVVRHHFQSAGLPKPQGTAKVFFKNAYSFQSPMGAGYGSYDRFARYSDYSEMEANPIIGNALNIFSDEVTQKDETGKIVKVSSDNNEIKNILQELFDSVLHLGSKNIWKLTRNLLKYGDAFYLLDITEHNGVVNMLQMPANEIEREEGFDKDEPSAIRYRWTARQNIEIPNAYVAHFRLDGNDLFHPYGTSALEAARRPWRQLTLLEDAMLHYRVTRAPERKIFFLDVQSMPSEDIPNLVNEFNKTIKKNTVIDPATGKMDLRYGSAMSNDEDYIIPIRGDKTGTRIETLPGGQNLGDIEDIMFIRANLFAALGIPKAFLTFDEDIKSKQILTQEDIRFARTVARVQEVLISELVKISMIHLYCKGYRNRDLLNFKITMTNPSTVAELQKLELWRARMDLVMACKEGVFDTLFIYKHFLKLSDEEIDRIKKGQIQDKVFLTKLLQIENSQGFNPAGGGMGGMGMPGGMGGMGGGLGGGMPMDLGGASPNVMGAPTMPGAPEGGGIAGEAKNLYRSSDGNSRTMEKRGMAGTDLSHSGDTDDDPNDLAGIKRTVSSPMGGREALTADDKELIEVIKSYQRLIKEYSMDKGPDTSTVPMGLNQGMLVEVFGEDYGTSSSTNPNSKTTKSMLKEAYLDHTKSIYKEFNAEDKWEQDLQTFEENYNKLMEEVELDDK